MDGGGGWEGGQVPGGRDPPWVFPSDFSKRGPYSGLSHGHRQLGRQLLERGLVLELDEVRPQNDTPPGGLCAQVFTSLDYRDNELPLFEHVSMESHRCAHAGTIHPRSVLCQHTTCGVWVLRLHTAYGVPAF